MFDIHLQEVTHPVMSKSIQTMKNVASVSSELTIRSHPLYPDPIKKNTERSSSSSSSNTATDSTVVNAFLHNFINNIQDSDSSATLSDVEDGSDCCQTDFYSFQQSPVPSINTTLNHHMNVHASSTMQVYNDNNVNIEKFVEQSSTCAIIVSHTHLCCGMHKKIIITVQTFI